MDDHDLIRRAQAGDADAVIEMYDLFYTKLFSFVMRKTAGDHYLTEDIISETWFKALKHLHQFRIHPKKPVIAWFYQIAHNELKMYWRRQHRYHFETLEEHPHLRDENDTTLDHTIAYDQQRLITQALQQLSQSEQQLIREHYFEYKPLTEIAQHTHTRIGTIKSRISRARKKLKAVIMQLQPEEID